MNFENIFFPVFLKYMSSNISAPKDMLEFAKITELQILNVSHRYSFMFSDMADMTTQGLAVRSI